MQVANHNYPQDAQYRLGDITKVDGRKLIKEIREEFGAIDVVLVGGSPCQNFSFSGNMKGSATKCGKEVTTFEQYEELKEMGFKFEGQSYLFWEFIRLRNEINPEYFMLENVRMAKKWSGMFNKAVGADFVRINSSLVSAQNRLRYYWFGNRIGEVYKKIEVEQPEDKRIILRDILEDKLEVVGRLVNRRINEDGYNLDIKPKTRKDSKSGCLTKAPTVTTMQGGHREPKVLLNAASIKFMNKLWDKDTRWRKMKNPLYGKAGTVCATMYKGLPRGVIITDEKLQEKIYKNGVCDLEDFNNNRNMLSNSQRYKMIGNGYTIDVLAHILKRIKNGI